MQNYVLMHCGGFKGLKKDGGDAYVSESTFIVNGIFTPLDLINFGML